MAGAIGYARVSTDEQARENNSLGVQTRKIAGYCDQTDLGLVKVFEGTESARTVKRPAFQEMLAYCRQHRRTISHVVVADLSRLARNAIDQAQTDVGLAAIGIKLVSVDDPITDDSAVGKLSRGMQGLINQYFSDSLVGISRDGLHGRFVSLLSLIEPTAELLAQLPGIVAARWRGRQDRISADAARLNRQLADQDALNQKAIVAKLKGEISPDDYEAYKTSSKEERARIEAELNALNSERNTMEDMLKQAEAQAVDLVSAWDKGNVNQRQELVRSFFPEGLVFSEKRAFFEPANTVITEMAMRFVQSLHHNGVPDGI